VQFVNPKLLIQPGVSPVIWPISCIIKNERKTKIRPIKAYVAVFFALSTLFGSPPELINLIPAKINKNKATTPANLIAQ